MTASPRVYVLHENPEWLPPLVAAFEAEGVPVEPWSLTGGDIDLGSPPPEGVFWSRLSASAHTRDHGHAKDYARAVLRWLESWGRPVVNGSGVLELEVSKAAQYSALRAAGVDVPRTIAVFGRETLTERAREFAAPFISKHNQGGKGLGVQRFESHEQFDEWVDSDLFEPSPDGITLLQEYLWTREPFITRAEFVGGAFVYAVRVDTSAGSFELCPAEACALPGSEAASIPLFSLRDEIGADHPLIRQYEGFLAGIGAEIAGIEFAETLDGRLVTYDVNTNTNYNPDVEALAPRSGPREIARRLGALLDRVDATEPAHEWSTAR